MRNSTQVARLTAAGLALAIVATADLHARSQSQVSENAKTACMIAVNTQYDGKVDDLKVISSEWSQANSTVMIKAIGVRGGSGSERWRCLVSSDGTVQDLSVAP